MRIGEKHKYHGAALAQIAEHPQFTAINVFRAGAKISRSAFKINDDIGVFLKYATAPNSSYSEYVFTFNLEHLAELIQIQRKVSSLYLALVCVEGRHICCLPYSDFRSMITKRKATVGNDEQHYTLLVTLRENERFRVYMNAPGKRGKILGKELIISRNDFPKCLFCS